MRYVRNLYLLLDGLTAPMFCEYRYSEEDEHLELQDCCHTCAFYLERRCRAPLGFGFFPRVARRMHIEA